MRTRFIAVAAVVIVLLALSPAAAARVDPSPTLAGVDPSPLAGVDSPRAEPRAEPAAAASRPSPHVRALTRTAKAFLADALQRSRVLQDLVERLEETDVVVYLDDSMGGCGRDLHACLSFLVSAGGIRFLIVRSDRWLVAPWDRVAWLAHELEHAMEIAGAPEVQDEASLARFYLRIGWQGGVGRFETSQARATGDRVRQQLAGIRR